MQDDEKKQGDEEMNVDVRARLTINRGYKLPLSKLSVTGRIQEENEEDSSSRIVQRSVIFVVDRSGSMGWTSAGRPIGLVKEAMKPFIQELCEDKNTMIKVVLFDHETEIMEIPRDRESAGRLIEQKVRDRGGTDFHAASKALVQCATEMLEAHPTFQLTVIMCSDGEVGKDNALKGHSHWKEFVNSKYLKVHSIAPYVETIGISRNHDADVLSGFVVSDDCGNYVRCSDSSGIREAFQNAQNETMARSSVKLTINFPLSVHCGIQSVKDKGAASMQHEVIAVGDEFSRNFWVETNALDEAVKISGELFLAVNDERVRIEIEEVVNDSQCRFEAIAFYDCILKEMLHSLRNITDPDVLRAKAAEIQNALDNELKETFDELTAEPADKRKLQQKIKALLVMDEEQKEEDMKAAAAERAVLMKEYKKMHSVWKQHKAKVLPFQNTLRGIKSLVREIMVGQVRMQEIRQHILDLHFRKTHQKRIDKLILSDEQLAERQRIYDAIEAPKEEDCKDISNEMGSGCYLSTLTKRECVVEAEPLWICGRVDRSGGAAVSNPELMRIEYISSDLVSDSYFRMAVETAAGGDANVGGGGKAENQNANVTFCDSSRQRVNCRLFPIYCNAVHYRVSSPYFDEGTAHTLSGRVDVRSADYNLPSVVIGNMISRNRLSQHNVRRLLFEVVPSMRLFLDNNTTFPFSLRAYDRRGDQSRPKEPLSNRRRCRLEEYLRTFKARTSAWVTTANVMYADRLLNMDLKVGHEFWLSVLVQRLRSMFALQFPNGERRRVEANHKQILQVLVCGAKEDVDGDGDGDDEDSKEKESAVGSGLVFDTHTIDSVDFFSENPTNPLIEAPESGLIDPDKEYDPNEVTPSMRNMLSNILSRIDIRDMLQAMAFFDVLTKMGPDVDEESCEFEAFSSHKYADSSNIPNDLNLLLAELTGMGCKGDMVLMLRAMCAVSIQCQSNKSWQQNVHWFGDDDRKQLFNDPGAVLCHIYQEEFKRRARKQKKSRSHAHCSGNDAYQIHKNPFLPDIVDECGDLPERKCGYSECGMEFSSREEMLEHVRQSKNGHLVRNFHSRSKSVLQPNPGMTFKEFLSEAKSLWDVNRCPGKKMFRAYYEQMQPIFMRRK